MTRPHCLKPDACAAKGAGHCRSCAMTAFNRSPEHRARVGRLSIERDVFRRPEVYALSHSREALAKREAARIETLLGWCPVEYRERYLALSRKVRASEARRMIEEAIAADTRREIAAVTARMRAKRERELREAY